MEIKAEFGINNLLMHKFDTIRNDGNFIYEVLEICTNTCYAGTQVFYKCRKITVATETKYESGKKVERKVVGSENRSDLHAIPVLVTLSEDELIEAPKEIIDIILNKGTDWVKVKSILDK